jgi:hypothetical protein
LFDGKKRAVLTTFHIRSHKDDALHDDLRGRLAGTPIAVMGSRR